MNTKSILLVALYTALAAAQCPSPLQIKTFGTTSYGYGSQVNADVAAGYKLIGGGFQTVGENANKGLLLLQGYPSGDSGSLTYIVTTQPVTTPNDSYQSPTTAYAIGLYDPNNCYEVEYYKSSPAGVGATTGTASITCPQGWTLTGGGADGGGFPVIASYPNTIRGDATSARTWTATFAAPAGVTSTNSNGITAYAVCVKPTGTGYSIGNFINAAGPDSQSSPPSSTASVYPATYALGGGGFRSNGLVGSSYSSSASNPWYSVSSGASTVGDGSQIYSYALGLSQSGSSTNAPTSSSAPTKTCSGQIITTARTGSGGSWTSGNTQYQIYDIAVKNTGQCPITRATYDSIFTGPNSPGVSQKWNIGASPSGDQILAAPITQVVYSNGVAPGTTLGGAGVVVYNATGVTGVAHGPTVFCDASCTNN